MTIAENDDDDDDVEPLIGDDMNELRRRFVRSSSGTFASVRRYRCLTLLLVTSLIAILIIFSSWSELWQRSSIRRIPVPAPLQLDINFVSYDAIMADNFEFHVNGSDVIVFLHIQKTGGTTFGKHLVRDIDLKASACQCPPKKSTTRTRKRKRKKLRCDCFRPFEYDTSAGHHSTWLFSRYSTGWKCGLHADWTELTECVDGYLNASERRIRRRYFYITFLRDAVDRYMSEFRHVRRGATWSGAVHNCNGVPNTVPPCYSAEDWTGAELDDFMACPTNLAANRQTRMLADLRQVGCYDESLMSRTARDTAMLNSAKANLDKMAFFGLTERQVDSQFLFQHAFNMNFKRPFAQHNATERDYITDDMIGRIHDINYLDVELYAFAKSLLDQRYNEAIKASS